MLLFFGAKRARRAALATVPNFVAYTRRRCRDESVTLEAPFVAGFLTIFITRVSLERVSTLNEDSLGRIQAEIVALMFNREQHTVGELISFQSARAEPSFLFGGANAHYFCESLFHAIHICELESLARSFCRDGDCDEEYFFRLCAGNARRERLLHEWSQRFETYL